MNEIEMAIKSFEKFKEMGYSHSNLPSSWSIELALAALREKQERDKGCEHCKQGEDLAYGHDSMQRTGRIYLDGNLLTADLYSESMAAAVCYCPMCGKRLEEHHEAD